MLRKLLSVTVLGLAASSALLVAGCAANTGDKPYALTGANDAVYGVNGAGANSPLTAAERARYTDQKGRFHAEWVGQAGR
jgi:hypothetical protein